ncbi:VTT domain-containing protein [Teredinibacter turnerae]|uniref:DedA family protein n=1 Tax=Teredinibacter turnerae TaxID=2426 RepID=UPI0003705872|nr:VTT domain-containing protein [Teredinibacter turnerae]
MALTVEQLITTTAGNPWLLAAGVILLAWLWEDAAVVIAALLSLDNRLPLATAFAAGLVGISTGDFALYILGRFAHRWPRLTRRLLSSKRALAMKQRFHQRTLSNIFLVRFIPGLRTVCYTFCGVWRIPLRRFLSSIVTAGALWVLMIFAVVHLFGMSAFVRESPWKWALIGVALVLLLANNWLIPKWAEHKNKAAASDG